MSGVKRVFICGGVIYSPLGQVKMRINKYLVFIVFFKACCLSCYYPVFNWIDLMIKDRTLSISNILSVSKISMSLCFIFPVVPSDEAVS